MSTNGSSPQPSNGNLCGKLDYFYFQETSYEQADRRVQKIIRDKNTTDEMRVKGLQGFFLQCVRLVSCCSPQGITMLLNPHTHTYIHTKSSTHTHTNHAKAVNWLQQLEPLVGQEYYS